LEDESNNEVLEISDKETTPNNRFDIISISSSIDSEPDKQNSATDELCASGSKSNHSSSEIFAETTAISNSTSLSECPTLIIDSFPKNLSANTPIT